MNLACHSSTEELSIECSRTMANVFSSRTGYWGRAYLLRTSRQFRYNLWPDHKTLRNYRPLLSPTFCE